LMAKRKCMEQRLRAKRSGETVIVHRRRAVFVIVGRRSAVVVGLRVEGRKDVLVEGKKPSSWSGENYRVRVRGRPIPCSWIAEDSSSNRSSGSSCSSGSNRRLGKMRAGLAHFGAMARLKGYGRNGQDPLWLFVTLEDIVIDRIHFL
jgi:hypothetical protein